MASCMYVQISELRASVSRCEQQAAWREERMKQEVSDLQQRLQEAEMRNQELSTTISQSTFTCACIVYIYIRTCTYNGCIRVYASV